VIAQKPWGTIRRQTKPAVTVGDDGSHPVMAGTDGRVTRRFDYLVPPLPPDPVLASAVLARSPATVLFEPGTTVCPVPPGVVGLLAAVPVVECAPEPALMSAASF
jgi:hypothetical protein